MPIEPQATMTDDERRQLASALRLLFVGVIFVLVSVHFTIINAGRELEVDVLDNAVGMLLMLVGLGELRLLRVDRKYAAALNVCCVVAVLSLALAIRNHWAYPTSRELTIALLVHNIVVLSTTVWFCAAMRRLCLANGLHAAARSWLISLGLLVLINLLPAGIIDLLGIQAILAGQELVTRYDSLAEMVVITAVSFLPALHITLSAIRTIREAERMPPQEEPMLQERRPSRPPRA